MTKKAKTTGAKDDLDLFTRLNENGLSTLFCRCGERFSWKSIDPKLGPWVAAHKPHMELPAGDPAPFPSLVDETMELARVMAGASWPSVDMTRWAVVTMARKLAARARDLYDERKGPAVLEASLLASCGLQKEG